MRSTLVLVATAALSSAALAQVGTDPTDTKVPAPAGQVPATTQPPLDTPPPSSNTSPPSTDDAAPADRADASATVSPTPGDPRDATSPPPKTLR